MVAKNPSALAEPVTEQRISQIGACLCQRGDPEIPRPVGTAQISELGEDEPHPVRPLPSGTQFPTHPVIDRGLCIGETLQVIRVGHCKQATLGRGQP